MKINYPSVQHIAAWKTGDGKVHETEEAARKHDVTLRLVSSMEMIPWREPDSDDILNWLLENRDLVKEALEKL